MTATNRELLDAWVEALEENHSRDEILVARIAASDALLRAAWGHISTGTAVPLQLRREIKEFWGIDDIYRTTRGET